MAVAVVTAVVLSTELAWSVLSNSPAIETNSFVAGTLTENSGGLSNSCTLTNIYPGQPLGSCVLQVLYTGSMPAYVGLDVVVSTSAGSGGSSLFNSNSSGVTFTLSDGTTSFTFPSGSQLLDELVASAYPSGHPNAVFTSTSGQNTATFTLTPTFATGQSNPNQYEGGSVTVTITAHAVQSAHNSLPSSCQSGGYPVIGASCTGLAWS